MQPNTTRRRFLTGAGAAALASACSGPAVRTGERRPNILFVLPDQMRGQAMGCMGNPDVQTPHMDRLAGQGILFRNTFANTPVCCPARAILQTGLYTHRNGMVANDLRLREDHVTVAELLANEGYRTGFVGKWHLDGGKRMPGWVPPGGRRQGYEFWAANVCSHRHFKSQYFRDTDVPIPMQKYESEEWTDLGLEFLGATKSDDRPFLLMLQMGPPHNPYKAPEQFESMYDADQITLRPNYQAGGRRIPGRTEIASYYGMVTDVDAQLGRLMDGLDQLGLTEDTIVLFSSDHGDMLGSQGVRLKRKPWEESIRVPGILRYPRQVQAGRQEEALFSHVDFVPTLLALCGVQPPSTMQGSDLSPLIRGESNEGPDSAFFQIFGPFQGGGVEAGWRGVRTQRHMYARYQDRPWVLYDLEEDPYEMNNLASDPSSQSLREEMDQRLSRWMTQTGDSWDLNWTHPVEDSGRLYRHQTFYTVDEYMAWAKEHPDLDKGA